MSKYGMFRPIYPAIAILVGIAIIGGSKMREGALSSDLPTSEIMTEPASPLALILGGLLILFGIYSYVTLYLASKKAKARGNPPGLNRNPTNGPGTPINRGGRR